MKNKIKKSEEKAARKLLKIISEHLASLPRYKQDRILKRLEERYRESLKWN